MTLGIVDIGKELQKYGLRIGEHPAFGGVSGVHAKGSYHYAPGGEAIDVTDWRPDTAPAYAGGKPKPWKQRTGELAWRAKQLGMFNEALGPGDPGHDTHVHLALSGKKSFTPQQIEWLATGRYKDAQGKLTDVLPSSTPQPQAVTAQTNQQPTRKGNLYVVYEGGAPERDEDLGTQFLKDYIIGKIGSSDEIPVPKFNYMNALQQAIGFGAPPTEYG